MKHENKIRIGTRGSKLAMWQAHWVRDRLTEAHPSLTVELIEIRTTGDKIQDVPLSAIGGVGLFTKAIESALLKDEIDVAVHSLKDLETVLDPGLIIGAVSKRHDSQDVLISTSGQKLVELPKGACIATSSLRRRSQLLALRPDLKIVDMRGNLDTRLRKLDDNDNIDAIIVARAGVERLGFESRITEILDNKTILSAVGQGALGIQVRTDDKRAGELVAVMHHPETAAAVFAERAFLRTAQGGCQVPIGALARVQGDTLVLDGYIGNLDGRTSYRESLEGPAGSPEELGERLAKALLERGGQAVLEEIRSQLPS